MSRIYPICFGEHNAYELGEEALQHILRGELAVRPVTKNGVRTTETVLSGGLHIWLGWEDLLKQHPEVVHLLEFEVDRHDDWFYARELQNGVITLKIPRKMFTGSAAGITMRPEVNYKSGYLWKTLYPMGYSEDEVIKVLTEAFENLDCEDSTHPTKEQPAGVLYGYALLDEPLKTIKLRIQVRGNQIQSAFPAWEQPATGNNGKPYSHWHSVNFNIAQSTVFHERYAKSWGAVFPQDQFSMVELLKLTPEFVLKRPSRDPAVNIDSWRDTREKELMAAAPLMKPDELARIKTYLNDYVCSKDPYGIQAKLYLHYADEIQRLDPIFNAAQVTENVAECIQVLTHSDLKHGTRHAMDAMLRFLNMAIVHTGGLNTLMFKRVLGEFAEAAAGHHDENSLRDFFAALAASPCRATLYTEFDLNSFVKQNNEMGRTVIGDTEVEINLKPEHLYEFIALNLGENYFLFSKDQRLAIARAFFSRPEEQLLIADAMSFLSGIDFQFFMPVRLGPTQLGAKAAPAEDDLIAVARDYGRMLVLHRQRVVAEDVDAYRAELDYSQAGSLEFFNLIRQKHKRMFVLSMHESMLKGLINYAESVGYTKLKAKLENTLEQLPREAIPMPKPVPDYLLERRERPPTFTGDTADLVRAIVGGNDASALE
ncbi:MAG: hypothetical protein KA506_15090 [Steroidobacteraceae bacterium]|nr:hypothetical protein [Steroidobacteraceae bacterium]